MKKIISTTFLLVTLLTFGQTIISKKNYEINFDDVNIGEKVYVKHKEGQMLSEGSYMYKMKDGRQPLSFWFSVLQKGEINGSIKARIGIEKEGELLAEIDVKNGVVLSIKEYHQKKGYLEEETYIKGDTIITKSYKETKIVYYKLKKIKGKEIYKYSCRNYYESSKIDDCSKIDFIKGTEEKFFEGKLISLIKTKNLPGNIKEVVENFDSKNKTKKRITYKNGVIKTFYTNGNYKIEKPIKGGAYEELYNSKGKLIDSGKVYDIMG